MPQQIRMWEVTEQNTLAEIESTQVNLEKELEDWLENDISVLDEKLLVIGRQVRTDYGGEIDLLCIEENGDIVVIELKRGKTPRDVVAQAMDYASWVKDLDFERIEEIASKYSKLEDSLEDAFTKKFRVEELPETLNSSHRALIVAESMDAATERIVRYLSEMTVPVNVATVHYFEDNNGRKLLARVFLVDPEVAKVRGSSKRRKGYVTINELLETAENYGIGELCRRLRNSIKEIDNIGHEASYARPNTLRFYNKDSDGKTRTVMFVDFSSPEQSAQKELRFLIHVTRFNDLIGISKENMENLLPASWQEANEEVRKWRNSSDYEKDCAVGFKGAFRTEEEVDKFIGGLKKSVGKGQVHK